MAARLTERLESDHFIFHYEPGDEVWVERSEAFNDWAVDYLDVKIWKKIDYYKFRTTEDMERALGRRTNGQAFPRECALATIYSWNNHKCFHIYNSLFSEVPTIRLYEEGVVVAHEFDLYNNNWVSQWNRKELEEPFIYSEKIREYREKGLLYPIQDILESQSFNDAFQAKDMVLYVEAGMFVSYLIDAYDLEKMKQVFCSVAYNDSLDVILYKFEQVYGLSVHEVEAESLANIDASIIKSLLRSDNHFSFHTNNLVLAAGFNNLSVRRQMVSD